MKNFKTCVLRNYLGGGNLGEYKIKPVMFLFMLGLLAATKTLFKRNKKKN